MLNETTETFTDGVRSLNGKMHSSVACNSPLEVRQGGRTLGPNNLRVMYESRSTPKSPLIRGWWCELHQQWAFEEIEKGAVV